MRSLFEERNMQLSGGRGVNNKMKNNIEWATSANSTCRKRFRKKRSVTAHNYCCKRHVTLIYNGRSCYIFLGCGKNGICLLQNTKLPMYVCISFFHFTLGRNFHDISDVNLGDMWFWHSEDLEAASLTPLSQSPSKTSWYTLKTDWLS